MNQNNGSKGRGRGLGRGRRNHPQKPNEEKIVQPQKPNTEENVPPIEQFEFKKTDVLEDYTNIDINFTPKPKEKFSLGKKFKILVNHFKLHLEKKSKIFQYDVAIKNEKGEDVLSNKIGKLMLKEFFRQNPIYENKILYDLKKIMYCTEKINLTEFQFENVFQSSRKIFKAFYQEANRPTEFKLNNLENSNEELNNVLQMIFTQNMKSGDEYFNFGKNFFHKNEARKEIGIGLDQIDGVSVSIRPTEQGAIVNLNKTSAAINQEGKNLIEILCKFLQCSEQILAQKLNEKWKILDFLKNLDLVDHLNKTVDVIDIFDKNAQQHKFRQKNDPNEISVEEYFYQKYGKKLQYPRLPLLSIGNQNHIPIEVCRLAFGRRSNLNPAEQSKMIKNANINCTERKERILEMVSNLDLNENDPYLKEYGIKMDTKMTELTAKKIQGATLEYGQNSKVLANCGRWDNIGKFFYDPRSVSRWILINCSDLNDVDEKIFVEKFIGNAQKMRLEINNPVEKFRIKLVDKKFLIEKIKEKNVQFLLIINNRKNSHIYNTIKQIGDIECGIVTQCIDKSILLKWDNNNKQYYFNQNIDQLCSNICLKVNCKLGGTNFRISKQDPNYCKYLKEIFESDSMIFGIDVNHPTPVKQQMEKKNENSKPEEKMESSSNKDDDKEFESIAAVVGSVDENFCIYPASVLRQKKKGKRGLETVYHLNKPVYHLLEEYKKRNKKLPKKLIFFRDGISDGQFKPVSQHELNEIRKACTAIQKDYDPLISYIVVQKRHQTRFFPKKAEDQASKKNENVPPGTIVDTVIVTPDKFDYFICSHLGIQGTSKPCHYYLLFDQNNFDSNKIIVLSFYLCHIYARSTTSVSYPAPTYYADLCAERGRKYDPEYTYDQVTSIDNETDRYDPNVRREIKIESA
ncbi:argonaute, partial [Brachionus plicatilis]